MSSFAAVAQTGSLSKPVLWLLFFGGTLLMLSGQLSRPGSAMPVSAGLLLLTAGVTISSVWFMQRAVGLFDFRHMTIPGFWFLSFLVMTFTPALLIVLFNYLPEGYSYALSDDIPVYGPVYLLGLLSGLVAVMLGMAAASSLLRFRRSEVAWYFSRPIQDRGTRARRGLFVILIAGAILPTLYYFATLPSPIAALQMFLAPDAVDISWLRAEAFLGITGPLRYFYALLSEPFYPYLIAVGLGYYLIERKKQWLGLFLLVAGFGLFFNMSNAARGPVATIALVTVVYLYLHRGGRASTQFLLWSLGLTLAVPLIVTLLTDPEGALGLWGAVRVLAIRMFYLPAYIGYVYFRVFPDIQPHPYGGSLPILAWLLNLEKFNPGGYVHAELFGYRYGFAPYEAVSAGGPFIGALHGEFGPAGVWLGCFLAGFIMQGLQIRLVREPKTVWNLGLYAYLFYAFWMLNSRALQTVLLGTGVIWLSLLVWILQRRAGPRPKTTPSRFIRTTLSRSHANPSRCL